MHRPWVVAHRGASSEIAEHTARAYEKAIEQGADAVECDVRLTRDGHLVCVHDSTLSRTSDGRGRVSEMTLGDLQDLDFSGWRNELPATADDLIAETPIEALPVLAFDDLLDLVVQAPRPLRLFVETKHPTRFGGLVEEQVVASLAQHGLHEPTDPRQSPITLMSFATTAVRRVHSLAPTLPTVQLYRLVPPLRRDGTLPRGIEIVGVDIETLRRHPAYVQRVHRQGNRCYVWTVDDPADVELALSLGVEGIITNRPAMVRDLVEAR
jgi:glycerophosphoryl diester phosphodiesterase